jgi:hypothetical protein
MWRWDRSKTLRALTGFPPPWSRTSSLAQPKAPVAQGDLDAACLCEGVIDSVTNEIGNNLAQPVFVTC